MYAVHHVPDKPAALYHRTCCHVGQVMPQSLQLCGQCCCVISAGCTDNAAGPLTCSSQHSSVGGKRNLHFQAATPPTAAAFHHCFAAGGSRAPYSRVHVTLCAHHFLQQRICSNSSRHCLCLACCRCAICVFPAVADIVSVAFSTLFVLALWATTSRMIAAAINHQIQRRLRTFQIVILTSMPADQRNID